MAYSVKPKPNWLFFIPSGFWVTLYPNIYHPKGVIPEQYPYIIVHEQVHLKQQKDRLIKWLFKYIFNRKFRLTMEVEAYATQKVQTGIGDIDRIAKSLCSIDYFWASFSSSKTKELILAEISKQTNLNMIGDSK